MWAHMFVEDGEEELSDVSAGELERMAEALKKE